MQNPLTPPSITGTITVCLNQQDVPYSISSIPNITNYTWLGPTGSHISDGINSSAGTTLITTSTAVTVDFGTTAGSIRVRANNSCASGSYANLAVAIVCRESMVAINAEISDVTISPNPNMGTFTMQLIGNTNAAVHVAITNSLGKKVYEFETQNQKLIDLNLKLEQGIL